MTFDGAKDATATVKGCPRCGEEHTGLFFEQMQSPIAVAVGSFAIGEFAQIAHMTHWALCPRRAEPILMRILGPEVEVR